jgi:hypothetical protein
MLDRGHLPGRRREREDAFARPDHEDALGVWLDERDAGLRRISGAEECTARL